MLRFGKLLISEGASRAWSFDEGQVSRDLGVSSMVVLDLEAKEVMNCFQRVGICCRNTHSATCWQLFKAVRNLSAFFFHHRHTGRHLVMDEHGNGEFSVGEHCDNVPSRKNYGETHSGSALRDFQSRRLNLRYRDKTPSGKGASRFCYTLNNTAVACPRVLISIIEQYQNPDGTVTVPEVLLSYMGNIERITR